MKRSLTRWLPLLLLCVLSACGGGQRAAVTSNAGQGNYAPPGSAQDPWGPYILEASGRFSVPQAWIRAVIHQESGGHQYLHGQLVTSDAGALGLMQLIPATYAEMSNRYGLGSDPYDPHDNIMAGTGYIHELYNRYGSPNFLVAYNAGPRRLETYLAGQSILPNETMNYVASIAPNLGAEKPLSGPLTALALGGGAHAGPVPHDFVRTPAGCWQDPDAAYDPDAPCRTAPPVRVARADPPRPGGRSAHCWQDPNAAYDPTAPCRSAPPAPPPVQLAEAAPAPALQVRPEAALPVVQPAAPPASAVRLAEAVPAPLPYGQSATAPQPVAYAQAAPQQAAFVVPAAPGRTGCWRDPNAAYDPAAPCQVRPTVQTQPAQQVRLAQAGGRTEAGWGQGQAGTAAGREAGAPVTRRSFASTFLIPSAAAATVRPAMAAGRWSVQVGAFASADQARRAAERVRDLSPRELGSARVALGTTSPFGGQRLYQARLLGLSAQTATQACGNLQAHAQACLRVPPGG